MSKMRWASYLLLLVWIAAPISAEPVVIGETSTLQSEILGEERALMVHLPGSYTTSKASYPVVYLLDAETNFHHTTGAINALSRAGHIPEMIVVAINNTDRTRDLTPTRDSPDPETGEVGMPTAGGADNFLRFINEELIPHVEATHRTAPFRILIGHSFGGLFALHAPVTSPETFDAYIAISPSLQWGDGELAERAQSTLGGMDKLDKYVFMSIAQGEDADMLANLSELADFLRYNSPEGLVWDFRLMEGDDHMSVPVRSTDLAGAIEIFEANVKNYPGSANVFDSLAEALEGDEQYSLAAENYNRAYERGQEIDDPNTGIYKHNLERVEAKIEGN